MSCKGGVLGMALCLAALPGSAALASDLGSLRLSAGYQYTSGNYGGSETITETYVPMTLAYRYRRLAFRVTVPYVSVNGPATIIDDTTGDFAPGPGGTHSGLGDVLVGATLYDLIHSDPADFHLDLTGTVKLGTAKASEGLGTGETDYALQLDALKEFGRLGMFATAGYVVRGNPGIIHLRNVPVAEIGADALIARGARAGLSFAYRTSAVVSYEAVREATLFVAFAAPGGLIVSPSAFRGFGNSSPSWGGAVTFGWKSTLGGS